MQHAPISRARYVQENRKMRFQEAYDGWSEGRLTQAEAALLLGQCERSFRRHIERFEADGLEGLLDKRLSQIKVKDFAQADRGGPRMRVWGKGGKVRYLPIHPSTLELVATYLEAAGHGASACHWLFQSVSHHQASDSNGGLTPGAVYSEVVKRYLVPLGIQGDNLGPHALRATAATCALENQADIAKVQEWLGHANINTTRVYDRRETRAPDSPTFKVAY